MKVAYLKFKGITTEQEAHLKEVFAYLAAAKEKGEISEQRLREMLGGIADSQFAPNGRQDAWDFGSWVDALNACEISWQSLSFAKDGSGLLEYQELPSPSGGIEATEEIIKIFNGVVKEDKKWWQLW